VGTSDGSAKVKMTMGSELLDQAKDPKNAAKKQQLLKQAEAYELQSLKIYPTYFPPLDILGNIYFELGNYEYSVHYFKQALKLKPGEARMRTNMEAVANMAKSKGEYEAAIQGYKSLVKLLRSEDLSRIYSSLGELYGKEMNDLVNSKKYLKKALKADPNNGGVYQKLGIVYAMTNRPDSAMVNFEKAYELDPENARVLLNLGLLNRQLGNTERANQYLRKAQEIDPTVMSGQ
jgi:tetratricopeptide (TPR) repeat protein